MHTTARQDMNTKGRAAIKKVREIGAQVAATKAMRVSPHAPKLCLISTVSVAMHVIFSDSHYMGLAS